ncbi:hypothetical protein [Streptomyces sp. NPDC059466]|uniref:hypothetical protein n=1 Tax=unclassified Streptomyces TaxID=2593676 RepID=UPI0036CA0509
MNPPKQHASTPADAAAAPPSAGTVTLLPVKSKAPTFEHARRLRAEKHAGPNARVIVRTWLTMGHWQGDAEEASRVADRLVDNAVKHGTPFPNDVGYVILRAFDLPDTGELAIEVEDALPRFPGFGEAVAQSSDVHGEPKGLWWVAHNGGRLSWDVKKDVTSTVIGKTVQAVLPATWDGAA